MYFCCGFVAVVVAAVRVVVVSVVVVVVERGRWKEDRSFHSSLMTSPYLIFYKSSTVISDYMYTCTTVGGTVPE
jgi:hypothetical protein